MPRIEACLELKNIRPRDLVYRPGDELAFVLQTLNPSNSITGEVTSVTKKMKVAAVAGGGFFGKVLIPEDGDVVLKTPRPDSFHEAVRSAAWGFRPFPAQTNIYAAQLEHLSTRLIHKVLPVLTDGKFYSPDSFGYAELPTGFAQVVEEVEGRGPKFDIQEDEYLKFKEAQKELLDIGLRLGLEHVGQIHPDNPFGLANLWYNQQSNQWVWMDTIPAIPHNMPFIYGFHKQIRDYFHEDKPTFNRIHTDQFLEEVTRNRHLFSEQEYAEIKKLAVLYEGVWDAFQETQDLGRDMRPAVKALLRTSFDLPPKLAVKTFRKTVIDPIGLILDRNFRKKEALKGAEKAKKLGLITEKDWEEALEVINDPKIPNKDKVAMASVLAFNCVLYPVMKAAEGYGYFKAVSEQDFVVGAASFAGGIIVPPILRYLGTRGIGVLSGTDLRVAAAFSAIPTAGNVAPVPAHIAYITGSRSKVAWHYFVRDIVANLSSLKPEGGWGTDLEARLWNKVGKYLEGLASNKQPFFESIGEKIGRDLHGEVYELGSDWVVKTLRLPWRMVGNWKGKLRENLVSDYRLLDRYLGDFIPATYMVEGVDKNGRKALQFVQKRIHARPLRDMSWEEIAKNRNLVEQLESFQLRTEKMYKETGRTPDLHGSNKEQYDLKQTKNLMVDENGRLWFVDIDLIGPLWSLNNPFGLRHMRKITKSVDVFVRNVQKKYLERKYLEEGDLQEGEEADVRFANQGVL